jgi:uncharacterized protein YndB with AHSA1/START domain
MNTSSTDRIERQILLDAPRSRVWRALTNAPEFGRWFGVKLDDQAFRVGERTQGYITYPGYEHLLFSVRVERMEPERSFWFSWHPYAVDPGVDYSAETPTQVHFELDDAPGGKTRLLLVESGFDAVPAARRELALRMNSGGWDEQMRNIERHVAAP